MKRILSLFLVAFLLCCLPAVAFAENGFNASLDVDRSVAGQIAVTVVHSSVLETLQPDLSIPCDESYSDAMVFFDGIACEADYADGYATFTVAKGGTYYIVIGAVPTGSTPATCVDAGQNVYVFGGKEYIETVGATGVHSYTTKASSEKAVDATCTEAATYYIQCDNCDAVSETGTVPVGEANGHDFTDTGKKTCANCSVSNPNYEAPYVPPYIPPVTPTPNPEPDPEPEQGESVTIPAESGEETTHVTVTVSGGDVVLEADEDVVAEIMEKAEQSQESSEVKLDLTTVEQVDAVVIPMGLVEAVQTSEHVETLVIETSTVSIEFDSAALETVVGEGTENVTVTINDQVAVEDLTAEQQAALEGIHEGAKILDLTMSADENDISQFGGNLTITVKYEPPAGEDHNKIVVKHVAKDGKETYIRGTYHDGELSFDVNHFSIYVTELCEMAPYSDVELNSWYHESVDYVVENGLMIGTGTETFEPNSIMDRASLAMILWRMEGKPAAKEACKFSDVNPNAWYAEAVTWATEVELIAGYDDGLCHPSDALTREQMVTILWRYTQWKGHSIEVSEDTSMETFSDASTVSGFACEAMTWAIEHEIIEGTDKGLEPKLGAGRSQIAAIIYRYNQK